MNYNLLILFIVLNIANVIIQTVKSLCTINCGKTVAALVNALAYGLYTVVLVYTVCELPLFLKAGVVAVCNLVGVFVVKWIEEKLRKDRLWKIEMTVAKENADTIHYRLSNLFIPNNYVIAGKWAIFSCYCADKNQSELALGIGEEYNAKTFASETKLT